jgi:hypothetical protein
LPQNRIGDRRRVHTIEYDGTALCRNPSREADPEGDSDALTNFLFEAARGAGHQLAGGCIVKENRRGVAVKKIEHPVEEQGEQFVQVESGQ